MGDMLVFGYVADASRAPQERMVAFAVAVSRVSGVELGLCKAHSYTELTELVQHKKVDVAWLPPLPFIALERFELVKPLVSLQRDGYAACSVLIVRADAEVVDPRGLRTKRAAWVDPHSAAGYVLPRIGLSAVGVNVRSAFLAERFFGSHEAVVRAVVERRADFGATYAGADESGKIVRGAWMDAPDTAGAVRVLATFGTVPADVIGAGAATGDATRTALATALADLANRSEYRAMLREVFGARSLRPWTTDADYEAFKKATMTATSQGLLDGEERGKM
jgi:ABC-type phosphate/phosphonate transport system substrate-binding protein